MNPNTAASIRQQLLNRAQLDKRPFAELLQYHAMERFLFRLSQSKHANTFILKGALLLRAWGTPMGRPTMDIDLLGRTSNENSAIQCKITDAINVEIDDGFFFDAKSIRMERITEKAEYEGVRVLFLAYLGSARVNMRIDIGFGDVVFPEPKWVELPRVLGSDHFKMLGYTRESAIAEKVDAMVRLGLVNSRMKDFHDIWLLSRCFDFPGSVLRDAFSQTLQTRGTDVPVSPSVFSSQFVEARHEQWLAYLHRSLSPVYQRTSDRSFSRSAFSWSLFLRVLSRRKPSTQHGPRLGLGGSSTIAYRLR